MMAGGCGVGNLEECVEPCEQLNHRLASNGFDSKHVKYSSLFLQRSGHSSPKGKALQINDFHPTSTTFQLNIL